MVAELMWYNGVTDEVIDKAGSSDAFRIRSYRAQRQLSGTIASNAFRPPTASREAVWMEVDMANGTAVSSPFQINSRVDGVSLPMNNIPDITSRTRLYFYNPSWLNLPLNSFNIGTTGYIPGQAGSTVTTPLELGTPTIIESLDSRGVQAAQTVVQEAGGINYYPGQALEKSYVVGRRLTASEQAEAQTALGSSVAPSLWSRTFNITLPPELDSIWLFPFTPGTTTTTGATNGVISINLKVGYFT